MHTGTVAWLASSGGRACLWGGGQVARFPARQHVLWFVLAAYNRGPALARFLAQMREFERTEARSVRLCVVGFSGDAAGPIAEQVAAHHDAMPHCALPQAPLWQVAAAGLDPARYRTFQLKAPFRKACSLRCPRCSPEPARGRRRWPCRRASARLGHTRLRL